MDERTYCLTPEQWRHAKACLTLAKRWGLIGDDSPEALERRRAAKNAQAERPCRTHLSHTVMKYRLGISRQKNIRLPFPMK